jgi:hypothetical protein
MLPNRAQTTRAALAMAAVWFGLTLALSLAQSTDLRPNDAQLAVACPNTRELVIDDIKICYFTCPDMSTSIRIAADQICPPFH